MVFVIQLGAASRWTPKDAVVVAVPLPMPQGVKPRSRLYAMLPRPTLSRALSKVLAGVEAEYVAVLPPGAIPIPEGLERAATTFPDWPLASSIGGTVAGCAPGKGGMTGKVAVEDASWQTCFVPVHCAQPNMVARIQHFFAFFRPMTAMVHRRTALLAAADQVAELNLQDPMLEEILITFYLAGSGFILSFSDQVIMAAPLTAFDHYRHPSAAYRRFLDPSWIGDCGRAANRLGRSIEDSMLGGEEAEHRHRQYRFQGICMTAGLTPLVEPLAPRLGADVVLEALGSLMIRILRNDVLRPRTTPGFGRFRSDLSGLGMGAADIQRFSDQIHTAFGRHD